MTSTFDVYDAATLPAPVRAYLDAHDEKRYADVLAVLAPEATVLDDGSSYAGRMQISDWLEQATSEFTFTATRLGQQIADPAHPVVQIRLDGDFPGGTALVNYRFTLTADGITRLSIGA